MATGGARRIRRDTHRLGWPTGEARRIRRDTHRLVVMLALCLFSSPLFALNFRFCYGLQSPSDLPAIPKLSLNTLYLQLEVGDAMDLQPRRELIRRAHSQGLQVIVGLPTCLTTSYRVSPYDSKYTGSAREIITCFVSELRDEPGVTAWATESFLERRLDFSQDDFRAYLQRGYSSLEQLNAHWGSAYPTWMSLTLQQPAVVDAKLPYRVGPATIDLANYKADAYESVMRLWAEAVKQADPKRPLLTGRVSLYRSLASIPDGYDVVCVSMPPEVLEPDTDAHNPQALDLARRGGRFAVLPTFRVPSTSSPVYTRGGLRDWVNVSALHGASGFALEDWDTLAPIYDAEQNWDKRSQRLLNALSDTQSAPAGLNVRATSAVLYSPYAMGFEVTKQPVYGWLLNVLPGEPSRLVYDLRLGTRYGLVDYLSVADLPRYDLGRYGCILAPACFDLPGPAAAQLEEYVRQGGALMADLGLGVYQTRSWTQLPPALQQAFGVTQLGNLGERLADLVSAEGLRALQPWPRGLKATGLFSPQSGETASAAERRTYPVKGFVAEALLAEQAAPLATASVRFDENKRPIFSGLVGHQHGRGFALFGTHPLWQYWPLTDPLSQNLHGLLMSRQAECELLQGGLLQEGPLYSVSAEAIALYNPRSEPALAQLWAHTADSRAYAGCAANYVANPAQDGRRPGAALLVAQAPAQQSLLLPRIHLIVQPYSDDVTVLVREYSEKQVVLEVGGAGCTVQPGRQGLQVRPGAAVQVRLILSHGRYPVGADSQHVALVRVGTSERRQVLFANRKGELDLSGVYRAATVAVVPQR